MNSGRCFGRRESDWLTQTAMSFPREAQSLLVPSRRKTNRAVPSGPVTAFEAPATHTPCGSGAVRVVLDRGHLEALAGLNSGRGAESELPDWSSWTVERCW